MNLYIATSGDDRHTGRQTDARQDATEGPLQSVAGALARIRQLKAASQLDGPVTVHLRAGTYTLTQPVVITPEDSWPVTFRPYRDERVTLSGGTRIAGWRVEQLERANGRRQPVWVADLPEVRSGAWHFRQLFVNGRRAPRPRLPRRGLYRMADVPGLKRPAAWGSGGQTAFVCKPGDVRAFANLGDVEVVYVHFWIEERSPIATVDAARNLVTMARPSRAPLVGAHGTELADYYLDNVREALGAPGEWYLDRAAGRLYYVPRRGETPANTTVTAPRLLQLVAFLGQPEKNAYVEHIRFEGLTFAHTDWRHPDPDDGATAILGASDPLRPAGYARRHNRGRDAAASQAACDVPGVIAFEGARFCGLHDCTVEHVGWYAVEIGDACRGIRVVGNTLRDLGAGGVRANGAAASEPDVFLRRTGGHRITDNTIAHGGRVFHSAVGVLSMHAFGMTIAHNRIHDLFYTGISCGWEWGYHENVSRDNLIAFNHIHHLGQGLLSDMGGIYTLGVQPGTVLRNNHVHDVTCAHYGGWCIYPDEGSSHILIENNVCHDADRHAFHQHYGRENVVLNNVFAFGGEAALCYSRHEPHVGFTMLRNIFVTDGKPVFASGYSLVPDDRHVRFDGNLLWDAAGRPPNFVGAKKKRLSWPAWRRLGLDTHSVVADPRFRDVARRDFRLRPDSPAYKLGFRDIDLSGVGPRPRGRQSEET